MLITLIAIYIVGFLVSLWALHRFKHELDIDHYDPPHPDYYDDYQSNAHAYATFSFMWPIFWLLKLIFACGRLVVRLSQRVGNRVGKSSTINSNQ